MSTSLKQWIAELDKQIFAAAESDIDTVGERLLCAVFWAASAWEDLREPVRRIVHFQRPGDRR